MRTFACVVLIAALSIAACDRQVPSSSSASVTAPASGADAESNSPRAAASFIDKVWKVSESSTVSAGTLYVFLSEGTLVVASSSGTPSLGKWKRENGQLTMIEEGIAYPTDILELTAGRFRIRSHNPGEPVEITLVPAGTDADSVI